jgi:hypothetical protein
VQNPTAGQVDDDIVCVSVSASSSAKGPTLKLAEQSASANGWKSMTKVIVIPTDGSIRILSTRQIQINVICDRLVF